MIHEDGDHEATIIPESSSSVACPRQSVSVSTFMKPAVPQAAVEPEMSVAAWRTFGRSSEENSSGGSYPPARQAWGRCLAVSMKTVYSTLAAWHPTEFSVWVVSHSSSPLPR